MWKGGRLLIPASLQQEILRKLHEGHLGILKTQLRARSCVFWPKVNDDIENWIGSCHICQTHQRRQFQEPMIPHEIPTRPWQTLAADLFHLDGQDYLLLADMYSMFPIVRKLPTGATSNDVIGILRLVFSEHGIPENLMSDNGGHFSSQAFTKFAEDWRFNLRTSSPHYLQLNGFIERQVQTIKNTLHKTKTLWC